MRCDSTDDDAADGQVSVSSQQLMDYSYNDHPQPVSADSFHRHSLDVASNGFLISISDNDR